MGTNHRPCVEGGGDGKERERGRERGIEVCVWSESEEGEKQVLLTFAMDTLSAGIPLNSLICSRRKRRRRRVR